jgi:hypothetical protein
MRKRIRIYANLPFWKPCLHAFWGDENIEDQVRMAVDAINGAAGKPILSFTVKDK